MDQGSPSSAENAPEAVLADGSPSAETAGEEPDYLDLPFCRFKPQLHRWLGHAELVPWPALMRMMANTMRLRNEDGTSRPCPPGERLRTLFDAAARHEWGEATLSALHAQCERLHDVRLHKKDVPPPGFVADLIDTLGLPAGSLLAQRLHAAEGLAAQQQPEAMSPRLSGTVNHGQVREACRQFPILRDGHIGPDGNRFENIARAANETRQKGRAF